MVLLYTDDEINLINDSIKVEEARLGFFSRSSDLLKQLKKSKNELEQLKKDIKYAKEEELPISPLDERFYERLTELVHVSDSKLAENASEKDLESLAIMVNKNAQYELGKKFEGKGNNDKAVEWYKRSARRGHPDAQFKLGEYYRSYGNTDDAMGWFERSLANPSQSQPNKLNLISNLVQCHESKGEYEEAAILIKQAASEPYNSSSAQYYLGTYFENNRGGLKGTKTATEWYAKAAASGNSDAQNALGRCYEKGIGVDKDEKKAFEFYSLSANNQKSPNPSVQYKLGKYYEEGGLGIDKDPKKAAEWYKKASKNGVAEAENALGRCYENGNGVEKDEKKAFELYKSAVDRGEKAPQSLENLQIAQYNLGRCYENGIGVVKDKKKAVELYHLAGQQNKLNRGGNKNAQYALAKYYEELSKGEKDKFSFDSNSSKANRWKARAEFQEEQEEKARRTAESHSSTIPTVPAASVTLTTPTPPTVEVEKPKKDESKNDSSVVPPVVAPVAPADVVTPVIAESPSPAAVPPVVTAPVAPVPVDPAASASETITIDVTLIPAPVAAPAAVPPVVDVSADVPSSAVKPRDASTPEANVTAPSDETKNKTEEKSTAEQVASPTSVITTAETSAPIAATPLSTASTAASPLTATATPATANVPSSAASTTVSPVATAPVAPVASTLVVPTVRPELKHDTSPPVVAPSVSETTTATASPSSAAVSTVTAAVPTATAASAPIDTTVTAIPVPVAPIVSTTATPPLVSAAASVVAPLATTPAVATVEEKRVDEKLKTESKDDTPPPLATADASASATRPVTLRTTPTVVLVPKEEGDEALEVSLKTAAVDERVRLEEEKARKEKEQAQKAKEGEFVRSFFEKELERGFPGKIVKYDPDYDIIDIEKERDRILPFLPAGITISKNATKESESMTIASKAYPIVKLITDIRDLKGELIEQNEKEPISERFSSLFPRSNNNSAQLTKNIDKLEDLEERIKNGKIKIAEAKIEYESILGKSKDLLKVSSETLATKSEKKHDDKPTSLEPIGSTKPEDSSSAAQKPSKPEGYGAASLEAINKGMLQASQTGSSAENRKMETTQYKTEQKTGYEPYLKSLKDKIIVHVGPLSLESYKTCSKDSEKILKDNIEKAKKENNVDSPYYGLEIDVKGKWGTSPRSLELKIPGGGTLSRTYNEKTNEMEITLNKSSNKDIYHLIASSTNFPKPLEIDKGSKPDTLLRILETAKAAGWKPDAIKLHNDDDAILSKEPYAKRYQEALSSSPEPDNSDQVTMRSKPS